MRSKSTSVPSSPVSVIGLRSAGNGDRSEKLMQHISDGNRHCTRQAVTNNPYVYAVNRYLQTAHVKAS